MTYTYDLAGRLLGASDTGASIVAPAAPASYSTNLTYDALICPTSVNWTVTSSQTTRLRATMVRHARDYRWSTIAPMPKTRPIRASHPTSVISRSDAGPATRREAYRALCREGLDVETIEAIRHATNGGFVLGNQRFEEAIARALGRRVTRGKPGRPRKQEGSENEQAK